MASYSTQLKELSARAKTIHIAVDENTTYAVPQAGTFLRRLTGLLFGGDTVLLRPCNSVHGFGMRRTLDVAYIDNSGSVIDTAVLKPWRVHAPRRGAIAVWELPVGELERLGVTRGSTLRFSI
ncbi:DUF192 domain-containing protein [Nesterenkonia rhizosphaerae]|uniref:DUF192 domain-containing protein n=1 Tax=Nesterenkonia rhizosphaerae TaxID=1348272 RepID=A0ABP9G2K7_9MICC